MTTPQTLDKDWLTAQETADYLGVNVQLIWKLVKAGKLHGKKVGGRVNSPLRISSVSIEKYMEK